MSPQFRTALYFFVQFFSSAVFHAYAGIWFASLGFSSNQIGLLSTFPILVVLLVNVFVGRIADRAKDWRQALLVGSFLSFLPTIGLLVSTSYAPIFIYWSLALVAQSLIVPVADAAALHLTHQGRGHIGTLRSLSTLGYVACLFTTGWLLLQFGGMHFALLFVAVSALRPLAALFMPNFKTGGDGTAPATGLHVGRYLKSPWFVLPLLGWATIYSTLQVLSTFLALLLNKQGISEASISMLFATGAVAEAVVFFVFRHISERIDLRLMVLISCAITILRWIAMAQEPSLPWLYALQSMHGISYGLGFIACITFISRNTPAGNAAEAQSLFNVVQQVTGILTITVFGQLTAIYGIQAFWGLAAIAALGTLMTFGSFLFRQPAMS